VVFRVRSLARAAPAGLAALARVVAPCRRAGGEGRGRAVAPVSFAAVAGLAPGAGATCCRCNPCGPGGFLAHCGAVQLSRIWPQRVGLPAWAKDTLGKRRRGAGGWRMAGRYRPTCSGAGAVWCRVGSPVPSGASVVLRGTRASCRLVPGSGAASSAHAPNRAVIPAAVVQGALRCHAIVPDVLTHSVALSMRDGLAAPAGLTSLSSSAAPCHRARFVHLQCCQQRV